MTAASRVLRRFLRATERERIAGASRKHQAKKAYERAKRMLERQVTEIRSWAMYIRNGELRGWRIKDIPRPEDVFKRDYEFTSATGASIIVDPDGYNDGKAKFEAWLKGEAKAFEQLQEKVSEYEAQQVEDAKPKQPSAPPSAARLGVPMSEADFSPSKGKREEAHRPAEEGVHDAYKQTRWEYRINFGILKGKSILGMLVVIREPVPPNIVKQVEQVGLAKQQPNGLTNWTDLQIRLRENELGKWSVACYPLRSGEHFGGRRWGAKYLASRAQCEAYARKSMATSYKRYKSMSKPIESA